MKTLYWALGAFAAYEVIAWRVNDNRAAKYQTYTPMPFDLIGKYFGYPTAGLGPEIPAIRVNGSAPPAADESFFAPLPGVSPAVSPSAAVGAAVAAGGGFNANTYPGVAAQPPPSVWFNFGTPTGGIA